jgi:hypothetical protein
LYRDRQWINYFSWADGLLLDLAQHLGVTVATSPAGDVPRDEDRRRTSHILTGAVERAEGRVPRDPPAASPA